MPKDATVNIGSLNSRIEIQSATRTADGAGGATNVWATITNGTVWANVESMSAFEVFAAIQRQHRVTHKITLRYMTSLTSGMRVKFGTRTFNIRGIKNLDERNAKMELTCEEGLPL